MTMLNLTKPPDWKGRRAPLSFGDMVPQDRFGSPVTWIGKIDPTPVYLDQFQFTDAREAYVMGLRYDTSKMLLNGQPGSVGFFLQFIVVEFIAIDHHVLHVLRQHRGPIYSAANHGKDWVWASELKCEVKKLCLGPLPKWKESEAQWPTVDGMPMRFVGQISLVENAVTKAHLTWDKRVYLFWYDAAGSSQFKLFAQDCDLQTAEEHYREE